MIRVKLLAEGAKLPTVSHPGADLGYDVYALENVNMVSGGYPHKIRTGIAIQGLEEYSHNPLGFLVKDRSSMSAKGVFTHGGVIDSGYRGEIIILLSYSVKSYSPQLYTDVFEIKAGDKIAQLIPVHPKTLGPVLEFDELPGSPRGDKGFGSSGR